MVTGTLCGQVLQNVHVERTDGYSALCPSFVILA